MPRGIRHSLTAGEAVSLIVSLALAFLIWLIINLSMDYSGVVSVPVVAECQIDGHAGISSNSVTVSARCRTNGFNLVSERYRRERRVVKVRFNPQDLRRGSDPDVFFICGTAKNGYVGNIFGEETSLEAFITDTMSFVFPAENHKKVPVELVHDISYRAQYMTSAPMKVNPDSVIVYGDAARLDNIDRVRTTQLNLSDVHDNIHGGLKLQRIHGVRLSSDEVRYDITVSRFTELRRSVPVEVWNVPAGRKVEVYPSMAEVLFYCTFPLVADPSDSFKLFIDYKDFVSSLGGHCIPSTLKLPRGVIDYRIEPEVFTCVEIE